MAARSVEMSLLAPAQYFRYMSDSEGLLDLGRRQEHLLVRRMPSFFPVLDNDDITRVTFLRPTSLLEFMLIDMNPDVVAIVNLLK